MNPRDWAAEARIRRDRLPEVLENSPGTIGEIISDQARATPASAALVTDHAAWTYEQLDRRAWAYADWGSSLGLVPGVAVALIYENCPDYLAFWIGMTRIGVATALINTGAVGEGLVHALKCVPARHLIIGKEFSGNMDRVSGVLSDYRIVPFESVLEEVERGGQGSVVLDHRTPVRHPDDIALYMYTSGTTGFPKAVEMKHRRILFMAYFFAEAMGVQDDDCVMICIPLYHGSGGICGVGSALVKGGRALIASRFSVSSFWKQCYDHDVTVFVYIGELCRYLLNAEPSKYEKLNKIRAMIGPGLRVDIWDAFLKRFKVSAVVEIYGATESNLSFANVDGLPGSVGVPFGAPNVDQCVEVVKCETGTGEPLRNEQGFCVRCAPREAGQGIGLIHRADGSVGILPSGYTDKEATEQKIIRNVFEEGDSWFLSGDLLSRDENGNFYFIERLGDTYRWKGENISNSEVEMTLYKCPSVKEVLVYGVSVPHQDGKAGMAAIVPSSTFCFDELADWVSNNVPRYARPVFLRLTDKFRTTGTYKNQRYEIAQEAFDTSVGDPVFVWDQDVGHYVELTVELAARIGDGNYKF